MRRHRIEALFPQGLLRRPYENSSSHGRIKLFGSCGGSAQTSAASPNSEVNLLTVIDIVTPAFKSEPALEGEVRETLARLLPKLRQGAQLLLGREKEALQATGQAVTTIIREGHPAEQIIQACHELSSNLMVVGSRGMGGYTRISTGSVSQQLLRHAPCSVLVVRHDRQAEGERRGWRQVKLGEEKRSLRILLAYDGSADAQAAVETLKSLPLGERVTITVLSVLPEVSHYGLGGTAMRLLTEVWEGEKELARTTVDKVVQALRSATPQVSGQIRDGSPIQQITQAAQETGADIIMVGSQGRSAIERFILGSVSDHTANGASCSVWLVRR